MILLKCMKWLRKKYFSNHEILYLQNYNNSNCYSYIYEFTIAKQRNSKVKYYQTDGVDKIRDEIKSCKKI